MALFTFDQPGAETKNGTDDNDLFVASNNFFGAGDRAFGMGGIDDFQYYADSSLTGVTGPVVDVFGNANTTKTFAGVRPELGRNLRHRQRLGQHARVRLLELLGPHRRRRRPTAPPLSSMTSSNSLANIRLFDQTNAANANVAVGYRRHRLTAALQHQC